jgi:hypothetical protein
MEGVMLVDLGWSYYLLNIFQFFFFLESVVIMENAAESRSLMLDGKTRQDRTQENNYNSPILFLTLSHK